MQLSIVRRQWKQIWSLQFSQKLRLSQFYNIETATAGGCGGGQNVQIMLRVLQPVIIIPSQSLPSLQITLLPFSRSMTSFLHGGPLTDKCNYYFHWMDAKAYNSLTDSPEHPSPLALELEWRSTQRFVITEKGPTRAIVKPSYNLRLKLYSPVYKSLAPAVATLALCQWPLVLSAVSQCPWATSVPAWPVSTVSTGQCPLLVSAPRVMVTYHSPPSTALRYIGHTAPDNTHLLCSMGHNGCRV